MTVTQPITSKKVKTQSIKHIRETFGWLSFEEPVFSANTSSQGMFSRLRHFSPLQRLSKRNRNRMDPPRKKRNKNHTAKSHIIYIPSNPYLWSYNKIFMRNTWYNCGPLSSYPATSKDTPNGLTPLYKKTDASNLIIKSRGRKLKAWIGLTKDYRSRNIQTPQTLCHNSEKWEGKGKKNGWWT